MEQNVTVNLKGGTPTYEAHNDISYAIQFEEVAHILYAYMFNR